MKYLTARLLHLIHLAVTDCGTAHARRKHPQIQQRGESDCPWWLKKNWRRNWINFAGEWSIDVGIWNISEGRNEENVPISIETVFCGYINKDGSKRRKTIRLRRFCVWLDSERVVFFGRETLQRFNGIWTRLTQLAYLYEPELPYWKVGARRNWGTSYIFRVLWHFTHSTLRSFR